jgi:hypothetical protein
MDVTGFFDDDDQPNSSGAARRTPMKVKATRQGCEKPAPKAKAAKQMKGLARPAAATKAKGLARLATATKAKGLARPAGGKRKAQAQPVEEMMMLRPVKTNLKPGILRVASDFSGMGPETFALRNLGVPHELVFCAETAAPARKFLMQNSDPCILYGDVGLRKHASAPSSDVFVSGFPCQPFSSLGASKGVLDSNDRGLLAKESLLYVRAHKPTLVVLENVVALQARHNNLFNAIQRSLKESVVGGRAGSLELGHDRLR